MFIEAGVLDRFRMAAGFDDLTVLHHKNFVGLQDRAQPVGDYESGAPFHQALQRILDEALAFGIECTGGFVKNQFSAVPYIIFAEFDAISGIRV